MRLQLRNVLRTHIAYIYIIHQIFDNIVQYNHVGIIHIKIDIMIKFVMSIQL